MRVLAISERTKRDLIELYGTPADEDRRHAARARSGLRARQVSTIRFLLFVSAIEPRKQPLAAIDAANAVGRKLVVVGPPKDAELAAELARRGADVRGLRPEGRAGAAVPAARRAWSSRRATRASACRSSRRWPAGRRSSPRLSAAMQEVAGDAAIFTERPRRRRAPGARRPRRDFPRPGSSGPRRSPGARPRASPPTSIEACSRHEGLRRASSPPAGRGRAAAHSLPALRASGRRARRRRQRSRQPAGDSSGDARVVENDRALGFSANVNKGIAATTGEYVVISNPGRRPGAGLRRASSSRSPTRIRAAASPGRR